MIQLEGVTKSYPLVGLRRYFVFRNLSLEFPERKNIAILGRNGAGKSTLLRLIGGIEYPDSGQIRIQGTVSPPLGLSGGFARKSSGKDNATFICRVHGLSTPEIRERVEFIERFAEIGQFFSYPVEKYSSGMRARLAFAISMAFQYDYRLIDELTAVGDEKFKQRAQKAFADMRGRTSVVIVSHNLGQLRRDCDVGVYVRKGSVTYFDQVEEAIAAYQQDNKED
jgi:capsular polysaccharide transport system ATP-binding protein